MMNKEILFKWVSKCKHILLVIVCFVSASTLYAQQIDILLKGGHVIDPKNKIDSQMDVAIIAGKISQVASNISANTARRVINVTGLYVTPGLIDMHFHAFYGTDLNSTSVANSSRGQQPDAFTFRSGVTTVVDAGSSGWRNFPLFKAQTIDKSQTRVLAFLNVVGSGMIGRFEEQNVTDMNPVLNAYMINRVYPKILVGIKSAHYWGDFTSVDKAIESGKLAKVPIMVDFGEHAPPNSIESLFLEHFRPGDIFTHTFSEIIGRESVVDEATRKVKPFVFEAQKKGVIFDVGHGGGAFAWSQAIPAFQQGFLPNVISSDLHDESMNSAMKDMANLLSKFLAIGMSVQDVILRSTWNPANVIQRPDLGNLSVGSDADVAVFNLRKGDFGFMDVRRVTVKGTQKLEAELTLRAGKIMWDLNGISGTQWNAPK